MTGLDASFLYNETPTLHMHTLKFSVLDVRTVPGGYSFERFVHELERRLHLLPPFRRRVVPVPLGLHHPVWIEDPDFDLGYHLRRIGVPPPGGRAETDGIIAEIASWPLDRSRPLWEIWVLEGLADGRVGFLAKVHHSVADGLAAAALLANVMTTTAEAADPVAPIIPWRGEAVPSRTRLVVDALRDLARDLARLPGLVRRTSARLADARRQGRGSTVTTPRPILDTPATPFNRALTPHRSFATATLQLGDVKTVRAAFGVSINDVVLAMVAGSLRTWLAARSALPRRALVASVPVGADEGDTARLGGNRVSNLFTSLCTDVDDPVERLHAIHEIARAAKQKHEALGPEMLAEWTEYTPPKPYSWFMRQYGRLRLAEHHRPPINLVVSNVPGPREPLFIAGARMEGLYSAGPILEGVGLNVTVWSYCDDLAVGVLACREQLARPEEIADGMSAALDELVALACATERAPARMLRT